MKYKTLIIGAGNIAAGFDEPTSPHFLTHAHAFTEHQGFELVGFVDNNKKNGENAAQKWNTNYFQTISEAWEKNTIDIVSIAVPDEYHFSVLSEIYKFSPKFILTEKPLTKTIFEAEKILELYKENKIPIIVNYKRRFIPEFKNLKQQILNNQYGNFLYGSGYYGKGFLHNGSHLIDLISYYLGNDWIYDHFIDAVSDYTISDPSYSFILKNSNNNSVTIKSMDSNLFTIFELDLFFEHGRIRITDTGQTIEEYKPTLDNVFTDYSFLQLKNIYKSQLNNSFLYTIDHIYQHLKNNTPLICSLEEGYNVMKLINNIITQYNNGEISNSRRK